MSSRNKQKLIVILLAILIPIVGIVLALLNFKFFHKKDK